jgi:hypothetical protein
MPVLGIIASQISGHLFGPTGAYDSIATTTVGSGGAASVTFSSIPATYTHLELRSINKNTGTSASPQNANNLIRFNSDTGSNYASHNIYGTGSAAAVEANTTQTSILGGKGGNLNASYTLYVGSQVTSILDYANTNKYKTVRTLTGADFNGSGQIFFASGLWMNTNAITSITITNDAGNLAEYSSFALYGIKGGN